ncbi:MAG: ATP phosphoribosyltransferase regulatory subunit [Phascolarctobacterium sp.]|nr:ATP phosphoribosyltransferase regulatory subunit [Phascolarctobacterium sp.]
MNKTYQVPYGTKDILPGEMKMRRRIEDAIIRVFDMWGYDEVKTPDFEYAELFEAAGKSGDFRFFDRRNHLLVLRNDMTAPIARLTATRLQGGEKVKRLCYLANLYRYEEIQEGRQCEFEQAGVEMLGASGAAADAEIIVLAAEAFRAAGLENFSFSLGHVGFIDGLAEEAGLSNRKTVQIKECLRCHDAVKIQDIVSSAKDIKPEIRQLFSDFLFLQGGIELLEKVGRVVTGKKCLEALDNLKQIYKLVEAYGTADFLRFDLGLNRSLDYYTGMLFEVYLPEMGFPAAGGGRYDKMMDKFGVSCPATGFAIGIERLILSLARQGNAVSNRSWDIFVAWQEGNLKKAITAASNLRKEGHSVKLAAEAMGQKEALEALNENGCATLFYV